MKRFATIALMLVAAVLIGHAQTGKVDVTGKWVFTVETSAGPGTPTITLKQDGEKLTGHYSGQLGESDLTGSIKGQEFTFTFVTEVQGTQLNCKYSGTVESKDALKGNVSIAPIGDGTFTAKRQ